MDRTGQHNSTSITDHRLAALENGLEENTEALKGVSEAINRFAVLEERHLETREAIGRAFKVTEDHETRIRAVESEMPMLKEMKRWVILGVLSGVGMMLVALFKLVVH